MEKFVEVLRKVKELGLDPATTAITSVKQLFGMSEADQNEIKAYLIADNFKYHYENNQVYRKICMEKGVTPEDVQTFDDLIKIPLVPVQSFKDVNSHLLLTMPINKLEYEMRSTGTSGIPSISRRDELTVTRCILGIYAMYREMFQFSKGAGLFLFPSPEEMPEMGMVKVLNMFSGLFDATKNLVKRATFKPNEAIEVLRNWEGIHSRHLIGPPFLIYKLVKYLKDNNIRLKLDKNTRIINLGGWKRFSGSEIPRHQYNQEIAEYLGIQPHQVRDMYGLVEANMLAIECESHSKHVPPWAHFSVRDPQDLSKEVQNGKHGVLAILDPLSMSYPCFIRTEDMVYLKEEHSCGCGRYSQQVVYLARVKGAEVGCCAINLEKHMDEAEGAIMSCPIN